MNGRSITISSGLYRSYFINEGFLSVIVTAQLKGNCFFSDKFMMEGPLILLIVLSLYLYSHLYIYLY